jgi:hypothetical protein
MRKLKDAKLRTITLSEIESLRDQGYRPLDAGDASMANSDYLMVMVSIEAGKRRVKIVCPSFLRGPLGFTVDGAVSY